ncbi:MAG: ferredoxin [Spirochaetales bacterium]|nr:ferredoxin [Spirochaetales bacterium]MCF7938310.1 ferredoxin [Spirochaetales bacterium]
MKYRIKVDKDACIADGVCYSMDPDHYVEDDEGKADVAGGSMDGQVSVGEFDDDGFDDAQDAADTCPVDAITVEKL